MLRVAQRKSGIEREEGEGGKGDRAGKGGR